MAKAHDPYLQAAEGFLHAIRDDIDQSELGVMDTVRISSMFALVSIARSLNEFSDVSRAPMIDQID
jgi:hypothetical protein